MRKTIVIVSENELLYTALKSCIRLQPIRLVQALSAPLAVPLVSRDDPQTVLVDLDPREAANLCRTLRDPDNRFRGRIVCMGRDKNSEGDWLSNLGADQYLEKPLPVADLLTSILAPSARNVREGPTILECKEIRLDLESQIAFDGGRQLELSKSQFEVLRVLMADPGRVIDRNTLIGEAFKYSKELTPRTIDVHVHAIRRQLGGRGKLIETVRGMGYRFDDESDE